MPYIDRKHRDTLDPHINDLSDDVRNMGDLNYIITRLCDNYLDEHGTRYLHINDLIGVLECAKLELYRRVAAPYEDTKIVSNGDVYISIAPEAPEGVVTPEDDDSTPRKRHLKWFFGS